MREVVLIDANRDRTAVMLAELSPSRARRRTIAAIVLSGLGATVLLWWFDPARAGWPICTFHALTGLDCPGCGTTRATHELLHGRLLTAWRYNALWVVLLPVFAYVAVSELRLLAGHRPLPGDLPRRPWFWAAVVTTAIVFFVVRNTPLATLIQILPT
jgi:hypothetical protein